MSKKNSNKGKPDKNMFRDDSKGFDGRNSRNSTRNGNNGRRGGRYDGKTNKGRPAPSTLHNSDDWYEAFPGSTDLSARISFGMPLGAPIQLNGLEHHVLDNDTTGVGSNVVASFPGIMRLDYMPIPGLSKSGDYGSAINQAARAYYTTVRYKQRGSGTYDDADLMLGVLGISSAYEYWAWLRRIYGILNMYSVGNRYLCESLLDSMGINFDSLLSNMFDFLAYINQYAYRLGSFCLPNDFHVLDRRIRMNSNLFMDGESSKAQMYYFTPAAFYYFDEMRSEDYGALIPIRAPGRALTSSTWDYHTIVDVGEKIITSIRSSSSLMNMAGDVKNAYEGNVMAVTITDREYMAPIVYDQRTCMEIQNSTIVPISTSLIPTWGSDDSEADWLIKAEHNTNTICCDPTLLRGRSANYFPTVKERFLNMRNENPTSQDIMRATRLTAFWERDVAGERYHLVTCGTEVLVQASIWVRYEVDNRTNLGFAAFPSSDMHTTDGDELVPWKWRMRHANLCMMEKFDMHPYIYLCHVNQTTPPTDTAMGSFVFETVSGDVDNVAIVPISTLDVMNSYATMGLFKTKQMDTFLVK